MMLASFLKNFAMTAATVGILFSHATVSNAFENPTAQRTAEKIRDIALGDGGVLRGQVVDTQGLPERAASVSVVRDERTVATTTTDAQGAFAITGITGGAYAISSERATGIVRAWTHGSAPPAASQGVLLVPHDLTARGRCTLDEWLQNHDGLSLGQIGIGGLLVIGLVGAIIVATLEHDDAS